jgi:hypothetical protein
MIQEWHTDPARSPSDLISAGQASSRANGLFPNVACDNIRVSLRLWGDTGNAPHHDVDFSTAAAPAATALIAPPSRSPNDRLGWPPYTAGFARFIQQERKACLW